MLSARAGREEPCLPNWAESCWTQMEGVQSHVKCTCEFNSALLIARAVCAEPCTCRSVEPCKSHVRGVGSHGFQSSKVWFVAFSLSRVVKFCNEIYVALCRRHKVSMWHRRNTEGMLYSRFRKMVSVAWQTVMLIWRKKKGNDTSIMQNCPRDISAYQNALISLN